MIYRAGGIGALLLAASGSAIPAVAEVVTEFATKSGTLVLTADDMADASPQFGPDGPGLAFQLQPEASEAFADLTEASVGQTMSLRVCGDLLIEAMVRGRLAGVGQIAMDSLGDATWYAARMRGDEPCDRPSGN